VALTLDPAEMNSFWLRSVTRLATRPSSNHNVVIHPHWG
jgi:hypothetical protein